MDRTLVRSIVAISTRSAYICTSGAGNAFRGRAGACACPVTATIDRWICRISLWCFQAPRTGVSHENLHFRSHLKTRSPPFDRFGGSSGVIHFTCPSNVSAGHLRGSETWVRDSEGVELWRSMHSFYSITSSFFHSFHGFIFKVHLIRHDHWSALNKCHSHSKLNFWQQYTSVLTS